MQSPGRFFAVTVMKTMLAHIVVHYDVKMEKDGGVPPSVTFGLITIPDTKARVMFRKRQM